MIHLPLTSHTAVSRLIYSIHKYDSNVLVHYLVYLVCLLFLYCSFGSEIPFN